MGRDRKKNGGDALTHPLVNIRSLNHLYAYLIIDELIKQGHDHFYISPGLRSVPLVWSINNHPKAKSFTIIDERVAAYRALGHTKRGNSKAVLICTSGTALANYYPALLEGHKSHDHLVVISADRELSSVVFNQNQTLDQLPLLKEVAHAITLPSISQGLSPTTFTKIIGVSLFKSTKVQKHLHLNIAFKKPLLASSVDAISDSFQQEFIRQTKKGPPSFKVAQGSLSEQLNRVEAFLKEAKNPLFVFASLPHAPLKSLLSYRKKGNLFCHREITSRLGILQKLQRPVVPGEVDAIIHFGGPLISDLYDQFKTTPILSISKGESYEIFGEGHLEHLETPPLPIILELFTLKSFDTKIIARVKERLSFKKLASELASYATTHQFFIGNSLSIRAFNHFWPKELPIDLYVNRGVSGIEGNIATAIGLTDDSKKPTILILGDISALHDLSSLPIFSTEKKNLKIIVMNNGGGKIFSHLSIKDEKKTLESITTKTEANFLMVAKSFGLDYTQIKNERTIKALHHALLSKRPSLIEVVLDDKLDQRLLKSGSR